MSKQEKQLTYEEMLEIAEQRERLSKENPDEFVLEDVKMIHYEVMHPKEHSWIGIYLNNGKIYHLNITGDNLKFYYSDETP